MPDIQIKGTNQQARFPDEMGKGEMLHYLRKKFNSVAEPIATIATSALAEPLSGLGSLPALIYGNGTSDAVKAQKAIQEWMTYIPKSEEGIESLQSVMELLAPVADVFDATSKGAGDYIFDVTGSPELAAIAYSTPTALIEMLGLGATRKAAKAGKLGKDLDLASMGSQGANALAKQDGIIGVKEAPLSALDDNQKIARLVTSGFIDLERAKDPKKVRLATTRYNKALANNPSFRRQQKEARKGNWETVVEYEDLGERKIITPEDLVGKPLMGIEGDRSTIGKIKKLGGIDLVEPVDVQGGFLYSQKHGGWASEEGLMNRVQNKVDRVSEMSGADDVNVASLMMSSDATNFSTPIAETMLKLARQAPLTKAQKSNFDKEFSDFRVKVKTNDKDPVTGKVIYKDVYPYKEWVGLDHPDSASQLNLLQDKTNPDLFAGKGRTHFSELMKQEKYRSMGFPSYDETIRAANDPMLDGFDYATGGHNIFTGRAGAETFPIDHHTSYNTGMEGVDARQLSKPVPIEMLFQKEFARQMGRKTSSGKPMTPSWATGAISGGGSTYELPDQQWLDNIMGYLEGVEQFKR